MNNQRAKKREKKGRELGQREEEKE